MAFRFPLETLLRVKKIAEEREERLLAQISQQANQARATLTRAREQHALLLTLKSNSFQAPIAGVEITAAYERLRASEQLQMQLHKQLTALEDLRVRQLTIYSAAHRDREMLEKLKETGNSNFQQRQGRLAQAAMDDLFLSKRSTH